MHARHRLRFAGAALAFMPVLTVAACSTGGSAEEPVTATAPGGITLTVERAEGLAEGDEIDVSATGLDPESGYYLGLCRAEMTPGKPCAECAGRQDGSTQKWFRNNGAPEGISADGTISSTLTVSTSGRSVDCTSDACVIKLFGDHVEGFGDIVEIPVEVE
ncbi:neocarzinostatin apoprotein domain-containing protein [Corynebacterium sphenisci]|uniref:neocarzinostatin apoprotein domain-containing protein n=1 Tax=Corynebacterium sphenisci TaxID=191493 RepID=UPI0009523185|nr:neocarzinostatin apoprotein domain-containing protein [Corynebacterium sphenisci]